MAKISYNLKEAAALVGVSTKTLQRAISAGTLIARNPIGRPLILHDDLMSWLTTDRKTA